MGTYHILHRGVGHFEACIRYDTVSETISPVEPSPENGRVNSAADDDDSQQQAAEQPRVDESAICAE